MTAAGYETVIGLEVHAQLATRSKLFCGCSAAFGAPPNTHTCPVCLGLPGSLPVPNRAAVELAMRAALALGCTVQNRSLFERKNYFYPDLAKGYQISQFELPLNRNGTLKVVTDAGEREVRIQRIHLEEDAAKNLHGAAAGSETLVDFNRAGVPLIEIVSEPDMRSAAEAEDYLRRLREILMFAGVNDGNLEEGSFRCDANVSIRPTGQQEYGTRTELKNINSFRFVRKAIEYEVARQRSIVSGGGRVVQETRMWLEGQGKTASMRSKEEAMDYRYFPDPDLPPIVVDEQFVERVRGEVPELPADRRARWQRELGLSAADADVLSGHPALADYFEVAAGALAEAAQLDPAAAGKKAANFIQAEVTRAMEFDGLEVRAAVDPARVARLLAAVDKGSISGKMAKGVLAQMVERGKAPEKIIDEAGMAQISDSAVIESAARRVLEENADNVALYRGGKKGVLGFFVGQVMKATGGSANPRLVNEALQRLLEEKA